MNKQERFIERASLRYNNKYDYSKSIYKGSQTPLTIICPIHGEFNQTPDVHIHAKHGCPKCAQIIQNNKTRNKIEDLIIKANKIHDNKYSYDKVSYINSFTPVEIICPIHGSFYQSMDNHVRLKCGCPKCKGWNKTTEEWIEKAKKVHGNKYDYSKSVYSNSKTKIEIICPVHGPFYQNNGCHVILKHGCPKCNESQGEREIRLFLENKGIDFKSQYKFENCTYKKELVFDFYIPYYNLCIEFDGMQHFKPIKDLVVKRHSN